MVHPAAWEYRPKPYTGKIVLFQSTDWPNAPYWDYEQGWRNFALGGIQTYRMPGAHLEMFTEPNCRIVAEKLTMHLQEGTEGSASKAAFRKCRGGGSLITEAHDKPAQDPAKHDPAKMDARDSRMQMKMQMSEAERTQILVRWNDTGTDYPRELCLHQAFEAQSDRTPGAVAAEYEGQTLTYAELDQRANQLAHYLRRLGAER